MNSWQRLVAVVGLLVAMGLALFPTWDVKHYRNGQLSYHGVGRSWVFDARSDDPYQYRILWWRFAMEQGIVWVPTVVIVLLLRRGRWRRTVSLATPPSVTGGGSG